VKKKDITPRLVARQAKRILGNFGWALAYAAGRNSLRWVSGVSALGLNCCGCWLKRQAERVRLGRR
jgi:hypothetical protein